MVMMFGVLATLAIICRKGIFDKDNITRFYPADFTLYTSLSRVSFSQSLMIVMVLVLDPPPGPGASSAARPLSAPCTPAGGPLVGV